MLKAAALAARRTARLQRLAASRSTSQASARADRRLAAVAHDVLRHRPVRDGVEAGR